MNALVIFLRTIHIFAGVFRVGSAAVYLGFIEPTAHATAPESGKFMRYFMERRRYSLAMSIVTTLTAVSGGLDWALGSPRLRRWCPISLVLL